MIFDRPTTRLIPTTLLAVSIGFAGGYILGYGIERAAAGPSPHWAGIGAGGAGALFAGTLTIGLILVADIRYWEYKKRTAETPPPAPAIPPDFTRLALEVDGNTTDIFYLPLDTDQLIAFTAGLERNPSLSGRLWYGANKLFSQGEFRYLRDEMKRFGLAHVVGNSYALTELGVRAFREGYVYSDRPNGTMPETVSVNKRLQIINRGRRGRGQGKR